MVMVSTIPGPQQRHSAASMLSISFFFSLSSASSFSMLMLPPSQSRLLFQMLRAFMREKPLLVSLTVRWSCFLRRRRSSRLRMSCERASTSWSLLEPEEEWALVASWRQARWKPCMQGKMQNSWLKSVLKHSSHLWLESISMQRFFTIRNQFLSCQALAEQLSMRDFSLPISAEQLLRDSQISSLKFSILMFWLKCGSRSSILTTLDFLVSSITSLILPFLIRQCLAISIHNFLRSSQYSGLSAYFLARSSLLCSRARATASPQRYILPQTMICASAILQLRKRRSPKSRSNSSLLLSISSMSSACFSLGLVAQKKMRMLCRLRSRLFSSSTQQRSNSMPCTRLLSGMFMRPGMSLMGLKSLTDLVSSCTVFSVQQRKKMCAYLQTTSTTFGSLTFLRYSSAFSQASSLRQCITIISKLFFLSAKLIRFWMRPCDCITRYTSSSFTTFRFFSSSSSSSRCFSFSRCTRRAPSAAPPQFSRSARSRRLRRQIMSSISQETSRQRWLRSQGLSLPSQALRQSSRPSRASSELTCRNFRKISSKVREVSLKQTAARSYWRLAKRWSAYIPATQETFQFLALQTAQASLYFFSSRSSFQASLPSRVVSSLMTPLLEKIQKMPVDRSQAMSETSEPLNSSWTTSRCVMLLMMEMLSWKSRQQWKSVTPMLMGVSCTWYAFAQGRSARLAQRSASFLARKESLTASSGSGTRILTMLLLLTHRMEVGRLSSLEQQTWLMDWQLLGICTSLRRSVWLRQLWMSGSRSSGPVKETSEELVKRMTTTQLRLLAWVSRRISRAVTSLLRYNWYCSTFCSRTSPFCSRSILYSSRMPPSTAMRMSPDLVSLMAPWKPTALMLTPLSSLSILTLLSLQLRQQLMPPSPAMMQCQPRGSKQMLRTLAERSLVLMSPRKFYLLVSGSSQALNSASTLVRHRKSLLDSVTRILVSSLTTSFLMRSVLGSPGSSVCLKMKTSSSICCLGSKPCSSTSSPSFISSPRSRYPYSSSSSESCWPFLEYISTYQSNQIRPLAQLREETQGINNYSGRERVFLLFLIEADEGFPGGD